jgi:hypothetical protein
MAYALEQDNYRSKRSYVTTGPFHNSIYTYITALNTTTFRQEGELILVGTSPSGVTLTATNCPGGRILRENGRKLYPGVNPGLLSGDTFQGAANFQGNTEAANHFWVGVFDAVTGVKGFINPNASTFSVYNSDKSLEVVDIFETNGTGVNKNLTTPGQIVLTGTTKAITYVATTSPYNFSTNTSPYYSFAAAAAVAITATGVPVTGTSLTIFYSGAFTSTPSTGFIGATVTPTGTQCIAVTYVSNGTVLIETARSGALPSVPTFP